MAHSPTIFLSVDFHVARELFRQYPANAPPMLQELASLHEDLLTERFIRFSAGGGNWPPLADSTQRRKQAQGYDPSAILIRTGKMSRSISSLIRQDNTGYVVGFINEGLTYPKVYSAHTVTQLAFIHHTGQGRNPVREVVEAPDRAAHKRIIDTVDKGMSKMIRKVSAGIKAVGSKIIGLNPFRR